MQDNLPDAVDEIHQPQQLLQHETQPIHDEKEIENQTITISIENSPIKHADELEINQIQNEQRQQGLNVDAEIGQQTQYDNQNEENQEHENADEYNQIQDEVQVDNPHEETQEPAQDNAEEQEQDVNNQNVQNDEHEEEAEEGQQQTDPAVYETLYEAGQSDSYQNEAPQAQQPQEEQEEHEQQEQQEQQEQYEQHEQEGEQVQQEYQDNQDIQEQVQFIEEEKIQYEKQDQSQISHVYADQEIIEQWRDEELQLDQNQPNIEDYMTRNSDYNFVGINQYEDEAIQSAPKTHQPERIIKPQETVRQPQSIEQKQKISQSEVKAKTLPIQKLVVPQSSSNIDKTSTKVEQVQKNPQKNVQKLSNVEIAPEVIQRNVVPDQKIQKSQTPKQNKSTVKAQIPVPKIIESPLPNEPKTVIIQSKSDLKVTRVVTTTKAEVDNKSKTSDFKKDKSSQNVSNQNPQAPPQPVKSKIIKQQQKNVPQPTQNVKASQKASTVKKQNQQKVNNPQGPKEKSKVLEQGTKLKQDESEKKTDTKKQETHSNLLLLRNQKQLQRQKQAQIQRKQHEQKIKREKIENQRRIKLQRQNAQRQIARKEEQRRQKQRLQQERQQKQKERRQKQQRQQKQKQQRQQKQKQRRQKQRLQQERQQKQKQKREKEAKEAKEQQQELRVQRSLEKEELPKQDVPIPSSVKVLKKKKKKKVHPVASKAQGEPIKPNNSNEGVQKTLNELSTSQNIKDPQAGSIVRSAARSERDRLSEIHSQREPSEPPRPDDRNIVMEIMNSQSFVDTRPNLPLLTSLIVVKEAEKQRVGTTYKMFLKYNYQYQRATTNYKRIVRNICTQLQTKKQNKRPLQKALEDYFEDFGSLCKQFNDRCYKIQIQNSVVSQSKNAFGNIRLQLKKGFDEMIYLRKSVANNSNRLNVYVNNTILPQIKKAFDAYYSIISQQQNKQIQHRDEHSRREKQFNKVVAQVDKNFNKGLEGKIKDDLFVEITKFINEEKVHRVSLRNFGRGLIDLRHTYIRCQKQLFDRLQDIINKFKFQSRAIYSFGPKEFADMMDYTQNIKQITKFTELCTLVDLDYIKYVLQLQSKKETNQFSNRNFQSYLDLVFFDRVVGNIRDMLKGATNKIFPMQNEGEELVHSISGNMVLFYRPHDHCKDQYVIKNLNAKIIGSGFVEFDQLQKGIFFDESRTIRLKLIDEDRAQELICYLNQKEEDIELGHHLQQ